MSGDQLFDLRPITPADQYFSVLSDIAQASGKTYRTFDGGVPMNDQKASISLWVRALFVSIVTVLAFFAAEGMARAFLPDVEPLVPGVGRCDSRLGWALRAGEVGVSHRTGLPIEYRINSKGLRDSETTYDKPEGVFRIVVVGDSNTFGSGVPIEKHFTQLLEGYFRDLEVINLGVSGFGIDQELLRLQTEGFRYRPDLVIAFVPHYGDHRHMHTRRFNKAKPRFALGPEGLVLEPLDEPCPAQVALLRRIHLWVVRHSRVLGLLNDSAERVFGRAGNTPDGQKEQDQRDLLDPAFLTQLFTLGEALVVAMHDDSRRNDAKFLLITQIPELHDAMQRRGILSLNVLGPMSNPGFLLPDDLEHMNEPGNGVLAWEITRFLRDQLLVPTAHQKEH